MPSVGIVQPIRVFLHIVFLLLKRAAIELVAEAACPARRYYFRRATITQSFSSSRGGQPSSSSPDRLAAQRVSIPRRA